MSLLTQDEIHKLEVKISILESMTSAEFKIIFCQHAWTGIQRKAEKLFKKYGLGKTRGRNAVLLLIVEKDREVLIYGDKGIHQKSSTEHWPSVCEAILDNFRSSDYYTGLTTGLEMIAENLLQHFPVDGSNHSEVCNEILFV
jgi:uncharacterized membrane protein